MVNVFGISLRGVICGECGCKACIDGGLWWKWCDIVLVRRYLIGELIHPVVIYVPEVPHTLISIGPVTFCAISQIIPHKVLQFRLAWHIIELET